MDPGIFVRGWGGGGGGGGGPGRSVWQKKNSDNIFFSPQLILILQKSVKWSISKKSVIFQGSRGVQHFPGGSNFFQGGGGGVQLLILYRNPYIL